LTGDEFRLFTEADLLLDGERFMKELDEGGELIRLVVRTWSGTNARYSEGFVRSGGRDELGREASSGAREEIGRHAENRGLDVNLDREFEELEEAQVRELSLREAQQQQSIPWNNWNRGGNDEYLDDEEALQLALALSLSEN
jgi:hypothetical protein